MRLSWKQILIAFVIGVIVGVVGARWYAPYHFHRQGGSAQFQTQMLQRFSSRLNLTPEQRTQVAAILYAKGQKIDALRAEIRPRFEEIRASTTTDIRKLLTSEQQKKFDAMNAEFEARAKRFRDRFRDGPPYR